MSPQCQERRGDWSALREAAVKGQSAVVRLLIDRGADINLKGHMGQTPLHAAAASKHPALAKLLLERGADHSAADVYRKTPLHDAASAGDVESAAALLSAGAAVDSRNDFRDTPLHAAAESGHAELARLLLARGADETTPARIAYQAGVVLVTTIGQFDACCAMNPPKPAGSVESFWLLLYVGR